MVRQDVAVHTSFFCKVFIASRGETDDALIVYFLVASERFLVS